jgi:glyoxylase I family protein
MPPASIGIEHLALSVPDPAGFAAWYVKHLACTLVRASLDEPYAHFLVLAGGGMMLELFRSPRAPVPDYTQVDPLQGHLAFQVDDLDGTRARLLAAGASCAGPPIEMSDGDRVTMLRDPWGVPLQLVRRAKRML